MSKLVLEYTSLAGTDFRVEIEKPGALAAVEICAGAGGHELRYDGFNQDKFSPIVASTCTLQVLVETTLVENFFAGILGEAEDSVEMHVFRGGLLDWTGVVQLDSYQYEYLDRPYFATITATDGVARLKGIDYNDDGVAYSGRQTLMEHLVNCLNKIPTIENLTGATLGCVVDWYAAEHDPTGTPLRQTSVDHAIWTEKLKTVGGRAQYKFTSTYKVLAEICQAFGARIMLSGGRYRLWQVNAYADYNSTEYLFDAAGDPTGSVALPPEVDIVQAGERQLLAIPKMLHKPPLRRVSVEYDVLAAENRIEEVTFDYISSDPITLVTPAAADIENPVRFRFAGSLETISKITGGTGFLDAHRYEFALVLRVGDRYLQRNASVDTFFSADYADMKWAFEPAEYLVYSDVISDRDSDTPQFVSIDIETPELNTGGEITIQFYLKRVFDPFGNDPTQGPDRTVIATWWLRQPYFNTLDNKDNEGFAQVIYRALNDTRNSKTLDFKLPFGDGPEVNTISRLTATALNEEVNTTLWGADGVPLLQLLANEIMRAQRTGGRILQGTAISAAYAAHVRLADGARKFVLQGATFNGRRDEWNGDWFQMDYDPAPVTEEIVQIPVNTDVVGTDRPIITKPGKIEPDTENRDIIQLRRLTDGEVNEIIYPDLPYSSLDIVTELDKNYRAGDVVRLTNPVTLEEVELTLREDYTVGDTRLEIEEHTFANYFPGKSLITMKDVTSDRRLPVFEDFTNIAANFITVTRFPLPDPALTSETEMNTRLRVTVNGRLLRYGVVDPTKDFERDWYIDLSKGNEIYFKYPVTAREYIRIDYYQP